MRYCILLLGIFFSLVLVSASALYPHTSKLDFRNIGYEFLTKPTQQQIDCLADNIYFESAHEPRAGKIAVALVTLNRVNSERYPGDICDVVYQKTRNQSVTVCQFSWVCESRYLKQRLTVRNTPLYTGIRDLAVQVFLDYEYMIDLTQGAMFYHANYINPGWQLKRTVTIGQHIFYK